MTATRKYNMKNPLPPVFTRLLMLISLSIQTECVSYTAGVVEFAAESIQPPETPSQLILRNAQQYLKIISTAADHGVDILVFPECGLTSIKVPVVRDLIVPYLTEIPEVGSTPCDLPGVSEVLKVLSCAARSKQIYVVVNLEELAHCTSGGAGCPSDGHLFYNTNLAFDKTGTIVARYRKFNLFVEPEFNVTQTPDHSWFDTDFGVRFGMFICFDILFKEPTFELLSKLNISNFVYSTAWFSELPFLTATPVQAAWAYYNDVNLLAAGYSNTTNKNAGSGIYAGRDGTLIATMPQQSSTELLIARVSSDQRGITHAPTEKITFATDSIKELNFFNDDLSNYTIILISNKTSNLYYENEGFRCRVAAELSSLENEPIYRLVAYSGIRSYAQVRTTRIEICGVVACANTTLSSCGYKSSFQYRTVFNSIEISAVSENALLLYPITMTSEFLPVSSKLFQFDYNHSETESKMNMNTKISQSDLITFALFRNG